MWPRALIGLLYTTAIGFSQVPAGPPFDSDMHPNPIVTFVGHTDFIPTTYNVATEDAGIDLLGLSSNEGTRESIEIAAGHVDEVNILGRNRETLFYPVVRQHFQVHDDKSLTLYSFRNPKPDIPDPILISALNQHAFAPEDDPEKNRFGPIAQPSQLDVRGAAALLFDNEGELTLFWQDSNASHVVDSTIELQALLRLVEDLL